MLTFTKEQRACRLRLRTLEARFAAIHRSQAVIEFTPDGRILEANGAFLQTMGYAWEEIEGRRHAIFVDRDYATSHEYSDFWEKLRRGEFVAGKFRRLGKDGHEVWIQASYNPVLDDHGNAIAVLKIATDITQAEHASQAREAERRRADASQAEVVSRLAAALGRLAEGDLTERLADAFSPEYERLREDYNSAIDRLQSSMKNVRGATSAIDGGASQLAAAAEDLSRRSEQQAATLEETAAALDEITATVAGTAERAAKARTAARSAESDLVQSAEVVTRAVGAMTAIETSSREIGLIIGMMDEIAFQTSLLALNAGVEAARAGDAGRGFAVVASEVRALAQRSEAAAKEIKGLIRTAERQVADGVQMVGQAGGAMSRIADGVTTINAALSQIASACEEQATGLAQVNSAVNQMDASTQRNAAMVEETTAAAGKLGEETAELSRLVGRFRLGDREPSALHAVEGPEEPMGRPPRFATPRLQRRAS